MTFVDTRMRPLAALAAGGLLLVMAACSGTSAPAAAPAPEPSAPAVTASAAAPSPSPSADPYRVAVGTAIPYGDEFGQGTITVSDVKIIKPPEGWGGRKIVVANVLWQATTGEMPYAEDSFSLVLPDGQRVDSLTVGGDDEGLPLHALGAGTLTGGRSPGDKARGSIAFDAGVKSVEGASIEIRQDLKGRSWSVGGK